MYWVEFYCDEITFHLSNFINIDVNHPVYNSVRDPKPIPAHTITELPPEVTHSKILQGACTFLDVSTLAYILLACVVLTKSHQ